MGGELQLESEPGAGQPLLTSTSRCRWPASRRCRAAARPAAGAAARAGRGRQRHRARGAAAHGAVVGLGGRAAASGERRWHCCSAQAGRGERLRRGLRGLADAGHGRLGDQPAHPRSAAWPAPAALIMVTAHGRELLGSAALPSRRCSTASWSSPSPPRCCSTPWPTRAAGATGAPAGHGRWPRRRGQRLAGLRLLVVEDNPINQQVARELLEAKAPRWHGRQRPGGGGAVAAADAGLRPGADGPADAGDGRLDGHAPHPRGPGLAPADHRHDRQRHGVRPRGVPGRRHERPFGKPFDLEDLVRVLRRRQARPATVVPPCRCAAAAPSWRAWSLSSRQPAGVDLTPGAGPARRQAALYERSLRSFVQDLAAYPAQLRVRSRSRATPLPPPRRCTAQGAGGDAGRHGAGGRGAECRTQHGRRRRAVPTRRHRAGRFAMPAPTALRALLQPCEPLLRRPESPAPPAAGRPARTRRRCRRTGALLREPEHGALPMSWTASN